MGNDGHEGMHGDAFEDNGGHCKNPTCKAWRLLWKRLLSPRTAALGAQSVQRALLLEAVILPSCLKIGKTYKTRYASIGLATCIMMGSRAHFPNGSTVSFSVNRNT